MEKKNEKVRELLLYYNNRVDDYDDVTKKQIEGKARGGFFVIKVIE